ncbi:FecR domain-containing protein [Archangium violaceum]|uniref:FecR domain-containing protein n=1 Tax=Archangium violaceum TaxID=83451 RepID=UPI001951892D|nr:FecR domain-containing protein [Archangium violaceum]QRN99968.1 FecR domain-containing protein [Archangium violaceum]
MARHEREALWALASGELDTEARVRVEAHVAGCDECAQRLSEVRETRALLRVARDEAPPVRWVEADERVLTMAARRFARLESKPRWPWMVAAMGVCAAVLLALLVPRPDTAMRVPEETVVARQVEAPSPTAQVEGESGAWARDAEGTEQTLQKDSGLRAGTTVRTPDRGIARLRLPDASHMQVSPDSEVVLTRVAADDVHLRVVRGRVSVQASHAERRGFLVEAKGLRVFVVGTVFTVENTPQGPAVSVLEGKVRVEAEGRSPQFATAGQRVELHSGEHAWRNRPLSAQDRKAFEALGVRVKAASTSRHTPAPAAPPPQVAQTLPETAPPSPEVAQAPVPDTKPALGQEPQPDAVDDAPPTPVESEPPVAMNTLAPEEEWQRFPAPREVEERFLAHARAEVVTRTCESYLVGLGEIAEQSHVRPFREEARYLRAQCYEVRFQRKEATIEYLRYLREYPWGRWAAHARAALLR